MVGVCHDFLMESIFQESKTERCKFLDFYITVSKRNWLDKSKMATGMTLCNRVTITICKTTVMDIHCYFNTHALFFIQSARQVILLLTEQLFSHFPFLFHAL